jgi:Caspase domain
MRPRTIALAGVASVAAAVGACFLAAQEPKTGKRYALLVGINRYDNVNFDNLRFAEADVAGLATLLKPAYQIRLLLGSAEGEDRATRENIEQAFDQLRTHQGRRAPDCAVRPRPANARDSQRSKDRHPLLLSARRCSQQDRDYGQSQ